MTPLEAELTAALEGSQRQVAEFRQENEFLRRKIDALVKRIFGARSEKIDPAQLELFMAGLDPVEGTPPTATGDSLTKSPVVAPPASRPKPVRRPRLPEHLPIVEEFVDPDIVLANPAGFRFVNQVVTEQLDFVRGHFLRRHIIRRKYAPIGNSEAAPIIAPLSILQERCLAAPGLLASIITGKYCDALPLFRQEQIFKTRHGVLLPRQTMARWMSVTAFWFIGIFKELEKEVFADGYVECDEPERSGDSQPDLFNKLLANGYKIPRPRSWENPTGIPLGAAPTWGRHRLLLVYQPGNHVP